MQIRAASIGEGVPRPNFDGVVHSCFDSAVNLRLEGAGRLVTLLVSDKYELPQGIRIASTAAPFEELTVGMPAARRADSLSFGYSSLLVDLRDAPTWKCRVRELRADLQSPASTTAWVATWALLNQSQRQAGAEVVAADVLAPPDASSLSGRLHEPVLGLCSAAARLSVDDALDGARGVIGLGPGVTPAGDDILVGVLAGMWTALDEAGRRLPFVQELGQALMRLVGDTTDISATYLWHASLGRFSSVLSNLAEAIAKGDPVEARAREAIRVGHSSGMDSVTGLLLGLSVWAPNVLTELHRTPT